MILELWIDKLIRSVSGGTNTSDNKYEPEYIKSLFPQLRERAIRIDYNGDRTHAANRRVDYSWVSKGFLLTKDNSIQNPKADHVIISCPRPVGINSKIDGFIYVGEEDNSVNWAKATSKADIANMKARNIFTGSIMAINYVYPYLQIYGNNLIKFAYIEMIAANPLAVPGFNELTDDYPVNESLFDVMVELFKIDQNVNIGKESDNVLDNAHTLTQNSVTSNLKA